jgi:hypothetical protein
MAMDIIKWMAFGEFGGTRSWLTHGGCRGWLTLDESGLGIQNYICLSSNIPSVYQNTG